MDFFDQKEADRRKRGKKRGISKKGTEQTPRVPCLQGGQAISCRSLSAKEPLITQKSHQVQGSFCGK